MTIVCTKHRNFGVQLLYCWIFSSHPWQGEFEFTSLSYSQPGPLQLLLRGNFLRKWLSTWGSAWPPVEFWLNLCDTSQRQKSQKILSKDVKGKLWEEINHIIQPSAICGLHVMIVHPEVPDAFFHSLRSLPTGFQCSDQLSSCREVASVVKFLGEQKSGEVYEMGWSAHLRDLQRL